MPLFMVLPPLILIKMKTLKKLALFSIMFAVISVWLTPLAHAAFAIDDNLRPGDAPQGYIEVYQENSDASLNFSDASITYIIADIAVVLIQMAGILAIFFLIMSGFNYIKAFGQEEEIQKAKKGLTWALIGLVVVIMSYAIVQNVLRITLSVDPAEIEAASSSQTSGESADGSGSSGSSSETPTQGS
jgi:hypothetical protein